MLRHFCGYYLADNRADLRTMQDYSATAIATTWRTTPALPGIVSRSSGSKNRKWLNLRQMLPKRSMYT
jgi:hypothetical protein